MNRRALVVSVAAAGLTACSREPAKAPGAPEAAPPAFPDPADTIRPIYAPYMSQSGIPRLRSQAPWSADLAAQIDAMMARSEALNEPILDFDPVINAQDWQLSGLEVSTDGVVQSSHAVVRARFVNMGRQDEVLYDLIWENDGWRVDNIRSSGWDLRQIITQNPTPLPTTSGGEEQK
jgi:hypothetical protein